MRLRQSIRGSGGNPERRFAVWVFRNSTYLTPLTFLRTNGDLDGYLGFHWQEEHKRNYQSRFANRPHLRVVK